MVARSVVILLLVTVLAAPFLLRPTRTPPAEGARRLVILTPHNEQIRREFGRGFDDWHLRHYGERVHVIFNVPGGTTEIRRMLEAQHISARRAGREPGGQADLLWGGGTFEHDRGLKTGVSITTDGVTRDEPISTPIAFDPAWLDAIYGENRIGSARLYDPDGYWFGTALSGFGIVYNLDVLSALEVPEPETWSDLCWPQLRGWVALVNPAQSGSITTAFDAILQRLGWERGWAILRRAGANARYFSGTAIRPPTDVGAGDAAMGVCIDFFGRYQAQSLAGFAGRERIGYVDPPGVSTIDPDPISMLRGAPDPQLAQRFIEYCLSEPGQALWQFRVDDPVDDGLGPTEFELRRLPIRRSMYADFRDRMVDDVNPYDLAPPTAAPDPSVRPFVSVLFTAMAMDNASALRSAWDAIVEHPAFPVDDPLVPAADVSDPTLRLMLEAFDAMPDVAGPDDAAYSLATAEHLAAIRGGWLKGGWRDARLWPAEADPRAIMRRRSAAFFRRQYERVVTLSRDGAS